jgi:hypothetical protein
LGRELRKGLYLALLTLIRSHEPARNLFMNLEHLSDEDLDKIGEAPQAARCQGARLFSGFNNTHSGTDSAT